MHDPNLPSLRKAARVTVVATFCFMVGNYVVRDLQRALEHCATAMSDGYGELANALRSGAPVGELDSQHTIGHHLGPQATGCAHAMEGSSQPLELASGVHLFELRSWLLELSDDLHQLGRLVPTLGSAPPPEAAGAVAVQDNKSKLPTIGEATRI